MLTSALKLKSSKNIISGSSSTIRRAVEPVHLHDGAEGEKRATLLQDVVREHRRAHARRLYPDSRTRLPEIRLQLQAPSGESLLLYES